MAEPFVDLGPVIATDLCIPILVEYESRPGVIRAIEIETVYGEVPDRPEYFRGHDSASGERRAFKCSRLIQICRADGQAFTEHLDWLIGQLTRDALGQPIQRRPQVFRPDRPVILEVIDYDESTRTCTGRLVEARLDYAHDGVFVDVRVSYVMAGRTRVLRARASESARRRPAVVTWIDGVTGVVVDDPLAWLDGLT